MTVDEATDPSGRQVADAAAERGDEQPLDTATVESDDQPPGTAAIENDEQPPNPAAVKRELARLARGEPASLAAHRRTVEAAVDAAADVERAAAFADRGGLADLAAAVDAAERAGDAALARRGRRARGAFHAFERAAAVDEQAPGRSAAPTPASVSPRSRNP